MEVDHTLALDGRLSLGDIYAAWKESVPTTWTTKLVTEQTLVLPNGEQVQAPIYAFYNAPDVDMVLIGGIHGREPAGAVALTNEIEYIIEKGKTRKMLVMPLLTAVHEIPPSIVRTMAPSIPTAIPTIASAK